MGSRKEKKLRELESDVRSGSVSERKKEERKNKRNKE